MNEMLGNQYFISSRYKLARSVYQQHLAEFPDNPCIKKKLIICNIKSNLIDDAFDLFYELVNENINCFFDDEYRIEECPCRQMIFEYEVNRENLDPLDKHLVLSILWLFRNINESIKYFRLLKKYKYRVKKIDNVLVKLTIHKNQIIRGN